MGQRLFVGNLPPSVTDDVLAGWFGEYGAVEEARVITDPHTGRPRGFGFVDMRNDDEAREAIAALHGAEAEGRRLTVNLAEPREGRGGRRS